MSVPKIPRDCPFDLAHGSDDIYTFEDGDPIETEEYFGAFILAAKLGYAIYAAGVLILVGLGGGLWWIVS